MLFFLIKNENNVIGFLTRQEDSENKQGISYVICLVMLMMMTMAMYDNTYFVSMRLLESYKTWKELWEELVEVFQSLPIEKKKLEPFIHLIYSLFLFSI